MARRQVRRNRPTSNSGGRSNTIDVATIDPGAVASDIATGTRTVGTAVAGTNIATGRQGTAAAFSDLQTGGLSFVNPADAATLRRLEKDWLLTPKQQTKLINLQAALESGTNKNGRPLTPAQIRKAQNTVARLTSKQERGAEIIENFRTEAMANNPSAADVMREADPETYANIDAAQEQAETIGQMTPQGQAFLDAAARGYTPGTISAQAVQAAQTEQSALGAALMTEAQRRMALQGRLSEQDARDATQSARAAFAARGLGTSMGSAAAELLNRDRFTRARAFEDLNFAQGVEAQDVARRMGNMQAGNAVGLANAENFLRAGSMQEDANRLGTVTRNQLLGTAASYTDSQRAAALGARLQMAGVQQAANPLFRAMEYDPYNTRGSGTNAAQIMGPIVSDIYGFNANAQNWASGLAYMNANAPTVSNGTLTGSPLGDFALNTGVNVGTRILFGSNNKI